MPDIKQSPKADTATKAGLTIGSAVAALVGGVLMLTGNPVPEPMLAAGGALITSLVHYLTPKH